MKSNRITEDLDDRIKMTRRSSSYKTLQKKLKELKMELYFAFTFPPPEDDASITNAQYHKVISEDIQQRLVFVRNLLTAEMLSLQDPSKLHHLRHIAKKLTDMESLFRQWDDHRISTITSADHDHANNFRNATAAASVCSCDDDDDENVESCRGDDGNDISRDLGFSSIYNADQDNLGSSARLVDVKVEEEKNRGGADDEQGATVIDNSKQKKGNKGGGFCGGLITGMIFGTVLMGSMIHRFVNDRQYIVIGDAFMFPT